MKRLLFLVGIVVPFLSACQEDLETTFLKADDTRIEYMGRVSFDKPDMVRFTYPGVSMAVEFVGTSIAMEAKKGSGYFMVEVDEGEPFKINFTPNDSIIVLADSLNNTKHSVRVMYAIEGYELKPAVKGFYIEGEAKQASKFSDKKIEFIGNSITCGYGCEATSNKEHFTYDTENHYYTYANYAARKLGAQHLVVARSGIGIYRNYGDKPEGSERYTMPQMYEQTLFMDSTLMWDFSRYTPHVVCVNLGTNDTSLGTYDTDKMKAGYTEFVSRLRGYYPQAHIVMLTGIMMQGKDLEDTKMCLDEVVDGFNASGDVKVHRFDMSLQGECTGADYHPSVEQHKIMGDELAGYLEQFFK